MCFLGYISAFTVITQINSVQIESSGSGLAKRTNQSFLLDLPHCRIPNGPLFPEEVLKLWNVSHIPVPCSATLNTGAISSNKILTLKPSVESNRNVTGCCYAEIQRPEIMPHDNYILSACIPLDKSSSINVSKMEYALINCTIRNGNTDTTVNQLDFHYNIIKTKPRVDQKLKFWATKNKTEKPMSIMILIIDSVSRTHAFRSLPKTMKYLTKDLKFLDFKGYHCVGEPSSVNYVPMTLGISMSDLALRRNITGNYDNEPFIHQNFSRSQYLTLQLEDMPYYNVFNFNGRKGFTKRPYDFYLRPYILSHETLAKQGKCMNNKLIYDFLLDYTVEFLETFPDIPKYTTTYLTWPNHDYFTGTREMDDSFLKYFQKIEKLGVLNNTAVFVVADHGFRGAKIYSESKYGLLERNLPMFLVKLPHGFINKNPEALQRLVTNSERLTSHFDFFKTIAHFHRMIHTTENPENRYGYNMEYGRSLLTEIPIDRNCKDAGIPESFCACNFPLFEKEFNYTKYQKPLKG